jgi:hypothetical protein
MKKETISNEEIERRLKAKGLPVYPTKGSGERSYIEPSCADESLDAKFETRANSGNEDVSEDWEAAPVEMTDRQKEQFFRNVLAMIIDGTGSDYKIKADLLAYRAGVHVRLGWTLEQYAALYGISKQDFHNQASELGTQFELPPLPTMKKETASKTYKMANHRNNKPKEIAK